MLHGKITSLDGGVNVLGIPLYRSPLAWARGYDVPQSKGWIRLAVSDFDHVDRHLP